MGKTGLFMSRIAQELRAEALELARGRAANPSAVERVAKATSPDAARWAFSQWELRKRAATKFRRAEEMFFVREALEQATHERVAQYHASLLPAGELAVDLTCGIGADLAELAARGPAVGIDLDPERAWCAARNVPDALVANGDSLAILRETPQYAVADPARRVEGRRTLDLNEFAPSPLALREWLADSRLSLIKLSPMVPDRELADLGPRIEFVSFGGECREALVVLGIDAVPGREAVHLESGERLAGAGLPIAAEVPGPWLYDLDPAAVRVGAAGRFELASVGDIPGYLTGADGIESPWLRAYRVVESGAMDVKRVRAILRAHRARIFEIKSRAAGFDTTRLRKELSGEGDVAWSLILWRQGASIRFALAEGLARAERSA
jgi:hypothetical protein